MGWVSDLQRHELVAVRAVGTPEDIEEYIVEKDPNLGFHVCFEVGD